MRKMVAMLLVLILAGMLVLPCYAVGNNGFLHSYYVVEENKLQCYAAELPQDSELTVTVGSKVIQDVRHSTVRKEDLPVTVYCLVDTSTAMSYTQAQHQKEVLLAISDGLRQGDSMVIATLGEELVESDALTRKEDRIAAIDAIARNGRYTDLFATVDECIATLSSSSKYAVNRCLVILSDGIDDGRTSVTEEMVIESVSKSTVPVYSVAVLDPYPGNYALEHAKHLNRFSDASIGGAYFNLSDTSLTSSSVGTDIASSMLNHSVIELDVQQLPEDDTKEEMTLMIRCETGENKWEDTMRVYTVDIVPVQETQPDTEDGPEGPVQNNKTRILVAAGVLLLAGAFAVVAARNKKEKQKEEQKEEQTPYTVPAPDNDGDEILFMADPPFLMDDPADFGEVKLTPPAEDCCMITLCALGYPDVVHQLSIPKGRDVVIGRDGTADIVLNPKDTNLSRRHCCMSWDGKILCVKDLGSRNGTIYNGTVMAESVWMIVENDTRLKLGKFEYRVIMQENT